MNDTSPPSTPPAWRGILATLAAGVTLGLGLPLCLRVVYGPSDLTVWPLLALLLGAAAGALPAPKRERDLRVGASFAVGVACFAAGLPTSGVAFAAALGAFTVAVCLAGPVATRAPVLLVGLALGALGATQGLTLSSAWVATVVSATLALVLSGLAGTNDTPSASTPTPREAGQRSLIALRLGVLLLIGTAGLSAVYKAPPPLLIGRAEALLVSDGLQAAAVRTAQAVAIGLALGFLGASVARARGVVVSSRWAVLAEVGGWVCVLLFLRSIGRYQGGAASVALLPIGVAGALAGVSLVVTLPRVGSLRPTAPTADLTRVLTVGLGLVFGVPVGALLQARAQAHLTEGERIVLALGDGDATTTTFAAAVEQERVRLRYRSSGGALTPVAVVEIEAPNERVRLLSVGGRIRGGIPTHAKAARLVCAAQVLAGALPLLLTEPGEGPPRVAVLGLGTGVTAGTVLRSTRLGSKGLVTIVESQAGVRAVHREPGDLFGFLNGRPLEDPRAQLEATSAANFLRGSSEWDVLTVAYLPLAPPFSDQVPAALSTKGLATWLILGREVPLRALRALRPRAASVWVFAPNRDEQVLLIRGENEQAWWPSLSRLQARWAAEPQLRRSLIGVGLRTPLEVLSTLAIGPSGLATLLHGREDTPLDAVVSVDMLRRHGADSLPSEIAWPEQGAPEAQAALAMLMARRGSPAALTLARKAVETGESAETLRVLGDVLHLAGKSADAEPLWRRAIARAPDAAAPRLSLGWRLHDREAWAEARQVLLPAVGQDKQREREIQYLLGRVAVGLLDYNAAKRHFVRAKGFKNAADLAKLAASHATPVDAPLTLPQRLGAGRKQLNRARAAEGARQAQELHNTVGMLEPLTHDPGALTVPQRVELAKLLRGCADLYRHRRDRPAAQTLFRLAAELLAPLTADARHVIARAEALGGAGQAAEGEALLVELLEGRSGAKLPRAHRILGDLRLAQKKYTPAIEAYRRCLTQRRASSTNVLIHLKIADAHRGANQVEQAIKALQRAERLYAGHPRVLLNLGTLLAQVGRKGDALTAYRAFLKAAPPAHPLRAQVEQRVRDLTPR